MQSTPRTLIRAVQKDLSQQKTENVAGKEQAKQDGARDLMKAFIGAESVLGKDHATILDNPVFAGCYPKIVDKVFFLERFAGELPKTRVPLHPPGKDAKLKHGASASQHDEHEDFRPNGFTAFEHSLICINISLAIGIVLTFMLLALFFIFLNSALYLKEEIS
jgi:hypothetical protein